MIRRSLKWFVCIGLVLAVPVWASEATEESPDIFSGTWGTAILTLAIFIVLLAVLGKWAWGPILSGLQKREEHIRRSIEEAEQARADGEKALQEYKEQLAQAQSEAQVIIEQGRGG